MSMNKTWANSSCASLEESAGIMSLVRPNQFLAGEELLKSWIVADRIPDWIGLELRDRDEKTCRHGQQSLEIFDGGRRFASSGLNLGEAGKHGRSEESVFLDRGGLCRLGGETNRLWFVTQRQF